MSQFIECAPEDAEAISKLASEIWHRVYPGMISIEQIEYMLGWMYDPAKIREDMERGVTYFFIKTDHDETAGYAAFGPDSAEAGSWLHKLYVAPEFHRRGLAADAIREVCSRMEKGEGLSLRVNRGNSAAIALYKKMRFQVVEERCSDIGGGFMMDDFVMRL